jgi:hypothetical protein
LTNIGIPGVGHRTMVSPFVVGGELRRQILIGFSVAAIAVVKEAHKRGHAERAGHQHNFVVGVVGALAQFGNQRATILKFALGEAHVAHECVQVFDERRRDFAQARVRRARHDFKRKICELLLVFDDHLRGPVAIFVC